MPTSPRPEDLLAELDFVRDEHAPADVTQRTWLVPSTREIVVREPASARVTVRAVDVTSGRCFDAGSRSRAGWSNRTVRHPSGPWRAPPMCTASLG